MSNVYAEQPQSLAAVLQDAGVRHGDTAQVTLEGVGVYRRRGEPTIAFCPAFVQRAKILAQGTAEEREQDIPAVVKLSDRLREMVFKKAPTRGFIDLSLKVHSNGRIDLDGRVIATKPVSHDVGVRNHGDYSEHCRLQSMTTVSP